MEKINYFKIFMYMDIRKKIIIKNYIKRLLKESDAIAVTTTDKTTILSQLKKNEYKPMKLGTLEIDTIKSAIKSIDKDKDTIVINNDTIRFTLSGSPVNFDFTLRKIKNPGSEDEFKYILWRVPFKTESGLGTAQKIDPIFSDSFDNQIEPTRLISILNSFMKKALLKNIK
jgi:hypothetical protein